MATNDPKAPAPSNDKKDDKVKDLPAKDATGADEQVKGGRMPLRPRDL